MGFELIIDRKVKFCWNNIIKFDNELTIGNNETEYGLGLGNNGTMKLNMYLWVISCLVNKHLIFFSGDQRNLQNKYFVC